MAIRASWNNCVSTIDAAGETSLKQMTVDRETWISGREAAKNP